MRHAHRLLSQALGEAARRGLVVRSIAAEELPPKVKREQVTILTANKIRDGVRKLKDHAIYSKVVIALFTGMRRGEILALRRQDNDLDRRIITVHAALEETKGGLRFKLPKSEAGKRDMTLPAIVVETLREYRRQQLEQRLALGLG